MTPQEESIAKAVGRSVGLFPKDMVDMLTKHTIVVDAQNYNTDQLVDAVFSGLHSSKGFNADFVKFLTDNADALRAA